MAKKKETTKPTTKSKGRVATTIEARTNQAISLATDLAIEQIKKGTAKSQVICHYLKLATEQTKLELEKLRRENNLLEKKAESLDSSKRIEELYSSAINAMKNYQGNFNKNDDDDIL